jgi:23S rRNA pseudouridine2605 synthase
VSKTPDIPLVRYLAMTGYGSRRLCDHLIGEGRVSVNSNKANHGMRVIPGKDIVRIDDEPVDYPPVFIYLLLNKPKGVLVSDSDPENRPLAKNLLPDFKLRLFPVGRLDFQTEGAIIFTNDGLFTNKIAHPRNNIPKTYLAKVRNIPDPSTLKRWITGIRDKNQVLKAIDVRIEKTTHQNAWLRVTLTGGVNRQVRRMGIATGHPVVKLIRLSIGDLELGTLQPGDCRELTRKEIKSLMNYRQESTGAKVSRARHTGTHRVSIKKPVNRRRTRNDNHKKTKNRRRQ